jgi:asparagine synthetase B (glutamine-hydrolysing)
MAGERAGRTGKSCITYNGETYNFRELRSELERSGRCFRTGH